MKKILITVLLALVAVSASHAQYKVDTGDNKIVVTGKDGEQIINIVPGEKNNISLEVLGFKVKLGSEEQKAKEIQRRQHKRIYGNLGFIELGFNEIRYADYSMYPEGSGGYFKTYSWQSWNFTMTIMNLSFKLNNSGSLAFTTGLQCTFNTFGLDRHFALTEQNGMVTPVRSDEPYKSSIIYQGGFRLPLYIDTNLSNGLYTSIGINLDFMGGDATVRKPREVSCRPYFNNMQVSLGMKVGWRNVHIYMNIPMLDLFKNGRGPIVNYNSIGLGFDF
mgnify:CR=1 FL=1